MKAAVSSGLGAQAGLALTDRGDLSLRSNPLKVFDCGERMKALLAAGSARKPASPLWMLVTVAALQSRPVCRHLASSGM
ncbi:MAG: hypothetical protein ACM3SW_09150 [Actinomycetota bacterium]